MKINFSKWTINQKLAALTLLLGFIAIFMRDPSKATIVSVDTKELSLKILDKSTHITPEELAHWLIEKKEDYKLIDLRSEKQFKEYSIPGSMNIVPSEILDVKLPKNQKLVLYSEDNLEASQTWFVLKTHRYKDVYFLEGGMKDWKSTVLYPTVAENASAEEKAKFNIMAEISKYFGGSPRTLALGGQQAEIKMTQPSPKVSAPAPVAPAKQSGGKSKREGC